MLNSKPIVQGAGHVIFADGYKCARYEDSDGNYYFTAELVPEDVAIMFHGIYEMN